MVTWTLVYTKQALKDAKKAALAGMRPKIESLSDVLAKDPYKTPPPYEKLSGELAGAYSRRINVQHRLVYEVIKSTKTVKIIRMWTHYE